MSHPRAAARSIIELMKMVLPDPVGPTSSMCGLIAGSHQTMSSPAAMPIGIRIRSSVVGVVNGSWATVGIGCDGRTVIRLVAGSSLTIQYPVGQGVLASRMTLIRCRKLSARSRVVWW